jgi:biotin carboxyl carrier protein
MAERLYRKIALERNASADQLDIPTQLVSPFGWPSLLAVCILIGYLVIWGVTGYIPVKVTGQGMMLRTGGMHEIVAASSGQVKGIYFEPGEIIERGRTVARLHQPELLGRIREASILLNELQTERERRQPGDSAYIGTEVLDERIRDAERSLQILRDEYDTASRITSPFTGRIVELTVRIGDMVDRGSSLMKIELEGNEIGSIQVVMYFPVGSGEKIRQGMEAQISPLVVERSEYGFLKGLVTRVSAFPSSRRGMLRVLPNEALVDSLTLDGPPLEAYADLIPDPSTPSGYKWSTSLGPNLCLQTGMICRVSVVVSKRRPIDLVFPPLKRLSRTD